MKKSILIFACASLIGFTAISTEKTILNENNSKIAQATQQQQDRQNQYQNISADQVPTAVQRAVREDNQNARIQTAQRRVLPNGQTIYRVTLTGVDAGQNNTKSFHADGREYQDSEAPMQRETHGQPQGTQRDTVQGTQGGTQRNQQQGTMQGGTQRNHQQGTMQGGTQRNQQQGTMQGGNQRDNQQQGTQRGTQQGRDGVFGDDGTTQGGGIYRDLDGQRDTEMYQNVSIESIPDAVQRSVQREDDNARIMSAQRRMLPNGESIYRISLTGADDDEDNIHMFYGDGRPYRDDGSIEGGFQDGNQRDGIFQDGGRQQDRQHQDGWQNDTQRDGMNQNNQQDGWRQGTTGTQQGTQRGTTGTQQGTQRDGTTTGTQQQGTQRDGTTTGTQQQGTWQQRDGAATGTQQPGTQDTDFRIISVDNVPNAIRRAVQEDNENARIIAAQQRNLDNGQTIYRVTLTGTDDPQNNIRTFYSDGREYEDNDNLFQQDGQQGNQRDGGVFGGQGTQQRPGVGTQRDGATQGQQGTQRDGATQGQQGTQQRDGVFGGTQQDRHQQGQHGTQRDGATQGQQGTQQRDAGTFGQTQRGEAIQFQNVNVDQVPNTIQRVVREENRNARIQTAQTRILPNGQTVYIVTLTGVEDDGQDNVKMFYSDGREYEDQETINQWRMHRDGIHHDGTQRDGMHRDGMHQQRTP
jgi:hypothetical protein